MLNGRVILRQTYLVHDSAALLRVLRRTFIDSSTRLCIHFHYLLFAVAHVQFCYPILLLYSVFNYL